MTKGFQLLTLLSWLILFSVGVFLGLVISSIDGSNVVEVPVILNQRNEKTGDDFLLDIVVQSDKDIYIYNDFVFVKNKTVLDLISDLAKQKPELVDLDLQNESLWQYWLNSNQINLSLDQIIPKNGDIVLFSFNQPTDNQNQ